MSLKEWLGKTMVLLIGKNDKATRERVSWLLKEFANDRANRGLNIFVDCNMLE